MADSIAHLQREYCPPLDSALLAALASDYDLRDEDNVRLLRVTLDSLKEDAATPPENNLDDPFRTAESVRAPTSTDSGRDATSQRAGTSSLPTGRNGAGSTGRETDMTSVSEAMSLVSLDFSNCERGVDGEDEIPLSSTYWSDLQELALGSKSEQLGALFPSLDAATVAHALANVNDDFDQAVETLLNLVFIKQEKDELASADETAVPNGLSKEISTHNGIFTPKNKSTPKGVDGFATTDLPARGRKSKRKKRKEQQQQHLRSSRSSSAAAAAASPSRAQSLDVPSRRRGPPENQWQVMSKDIDFLASRLSMPRSIISSVYHAGHPSISSTLHAILEFESQGLSLDDPDNDPVMQVHAVELGEEFPTIPSLYIFALIRLTHPSTATAHELAKELRVLTNLPNSTLERPSIEIITRTPPPIEFIPSTPTNLNSPSPDDTNGSPISAIKAASLSAQHRQAHLQASARALSAHHRSSTDRVTRGGESAHYSSIARAHESQARRYESLTADAIVLQQSTENGVDLHGISVKDALRIARERVQAWWDGLGEKKLDHRVREHLEYRVITGQGRHSRDGRSKIGPAVGRMLLKEGWKVRFEQGVLVVNGRVRK
ncbi:MAG: hypothetical protein M1823_005036 [Watsoniomyces obsoletus]|nr:MAG: hypothetical protein M1823_005036 [Watsoniomyces obsoletus]